MYEDKVKAIVIQAIKKLNKVKGLDLSLSILHETVNSNNEAIFNFGVYGSLINEIYCQISYKDLNKAVQADEPQNLPLSEVQLLRVAKIIYDEYKKEINNILNAAANICSSGTTLAVDAGQYQTLTASSITNTIDTKIDDLEADLRKEIEQLQSELQRVQSINDMLIDVLRQKGIM